MKHSPKLFPTLFVSAVAALTVASVSPTFAGNQGRGAHAGSSMRTHASIASSARGAYAPAARTATASRTPLKAYSSRVYGGVGSPHIATGRGLIATRTGGGGINILERRTAYATGSTQGFTPSTMGTGFHRRFRRGLGYGIAGVGLGYGIGSYGTSYGYDESTYNYGYGTGSYGLTSDGYGQDFYLGGYRYRPTGYNPSTSSSVGVYGPDYAAPSNGFRTSRYPSTYGTTPNCTCGS